MFLPVSLEVLRTLFIVVLVYFVTVSKSKLKNTEARSGWSLIQIGVILILVGSILDSTGGIVFFQKNILFGKSCLNSIICNLFGYLPGMVLCVAGFVKWIPKVQQTESRKNELQSDNVKISDVSKRLNSILKSIGDAVIAVNRDNKIILINPEAERITGWTEKQALGRVLKSVYHTEEEIFFDENGVIDTLLSDYANDSSFETIKIEDKFANTRLVSSTVTPMMGDNGIDGMVIIFREVELLETMQQRLSQKQKMESLSIFANGVAHDFNNQLTGVQGFCELLESEISDKEQLDYISEIRRAVDRSIELTDKLLAFARKEEPRNEDLNIVDLVEEIIPSFESEEKLKITKNFERRDLEVLGNRSRLIKVITDLLNNAQEAVAESGEIGISVKHELLDEDFLKYYPYSIPVGEYVCLEINDDGIGMNSETIQKVFEPFFTTQRRSYGKGMGLSSAYGTVARHDGLIIINSEFEVGTNVKVYLPIISEDSGLMSGVSPDSKMILVVDDEEFIRFYIRKEFERRGFKTKIFEDARSALNYYRSHRDQFSGAIIDCIMPNISGTQLMSKLQEETKDFKVLLMSGKILDERDEKIIQNNKNCSFIQKPFDGETLIDNFKALVSEL